mgnify:CR=1 FL=1
MPLSQLLERTPGMFPGGLIEAWGRGAMWPPPLIMKNCPGVVVPHGQDVVPHGHGGQGRGLAAPCYSLKNWPLGWFPRSLFKT